MTDDKPATPKQILFSHHYLATHNATEAAKRTGTPEKSAAQVGSRMLRNVKVRSIIDARLSELKDTLQITQENVLREYARLAFYDPGKLFDDEGKPIPINELDEDTRRCIEGVKVVEHEAITPREGQEDLKLVTRVHHLTTAKKRPALRDLGQHLDLFDQDYEDKKRPIHINVRIGKPKE